MPVKLTFIVAGVLLTKDEKFLLVQEKNPKVYGLWNLPAGKVDEGYTIEETAIKEAKEESGFDVKLKDQILLYHPDADHPILHIFSADIVDGEIAFPEDEILDVRWFTYEEIVNTQDKLRSPWIIECIRSYIK